MNIKEKLGEYLKERGIEYYAVIDLADCRITKPYLLERIGISSGCAIVFLAPYYAGECVNISRYAASRDYHIFLREIGAGVGRIIEEELGARFAAFGDHSPIDERDAAAKCSLGVIGDNGLLINSEYGSYVFIGEVVTDAKAELLGAKAPTRVEFCEHCGACAAACPKERIGVCLSALTQKKGELSRAERDAIGRYATAWGCDICQKVCPHNRYPRPTPIEFFREARTPQIDRQAIEKMDADTFASRAYSWRGKETLLRNLEILEDATRVEKTGET